MQVSDVLEALATTSDASWEIQCANGNEDGWEERAEEALLMTHGMARNTSTQRSAVTKNDVVAMTEMKG